MRPYVDPRPGSVSSQPSQPQSLSVILASRVQYPAPIHLGSRHPWRSCEGIPTRFQHGTSNYNLILLYNLLQSIIYNLLCILLLSLTLHLLYLLTLVLAPSKTERKKRHSWATAVTPKTWNDHGFQDCLRCDEEHPSSGPAIAQCTCEQFYPVEKP